MGEGGCGGGHRPRSTNSFIPKEFHLVFVQTFQTFTNTGQEDNIIAQPKTDNWFSFSLLFFFYIVFDRLAVCLSVVFVA